MLDQPIFLFDDIMNSHHYVTLRYNDILRRNNMLVTLRINYYNEVLFFADAIVFISTGAAETITKTHLAPELFVLNPH